MTQRNYSHAKSKPPDEKFAKELQTTWEILWGGGEFDQRGKRAWGQGRRLACRRCWNHHHHSLIHCLQRMFSCGTRARGRRAKAGSAHDHATPRNDSGTVAIDIHPFFLILAALGSLTPSSLHALVWIAMVAGEDLGSYVALHGIIPFSSTCFVLKGSSSLHAQEEKLVVCTLLFFV